MKLAFGLQCKSNTKCPAIQIRMEWCVDVLGGPRGQRVCVSLYVNQIVYDHTFNSLLHGNPRDASLKRQNGLLRQLQESYDRNEIHSGDKTKHFEGYLKLYKPQQGSQ